MIVYTLALLLPACRSSEGPPVPSGTQPDPFPVDSVAHSGAPPDTGSPTPDDPDPYTWGALAFDGPVPKNLLIVSLDTTRRDFLGWFAGTDTTPNLDQVLSDAVVLENHRSCSNWTGPSMTCLMSGRSAFESGFWPFNTDPQLRNRPPDTWDTLPMYLAEQGTTSVLVTSNPVFSDQTGISDGFDSLVRVDYEPATNVTNSALAALDLLLAADPPWLLQVHYFDPHASYCAPEQWLDLDQYEDFHYDLCEEDVYDLAEQMPDWPPDDQAAFLNNVHARYRAEIAYWDSEFGRLWSEAGVRGALDDTLVVFVTDHGEQFLERGYLGHGYGFGQEENLAVAAFWAENLAPRGWDGVTVHQDVVETLYQLRGIVPVTPTEGILAGTGALDRTVTGMNYWSSAQVTMMAATRDRQLRYDFWGNKRLHRLDADPAGLVDVYDPTDPDVIALWEVLQPLVDEVAASWDFLAPPVDPGP